MYFSYTTCTCAVRIIMLFGARLRQKLIMCTQDQQQANICLHRPADLRTPCCSFPSRKTTVLVSQWDEIIPRNLAKDCWSKRSEPGRINC
jgi:hypothetical protein